MTETIDDNIRRAFEDVRDDFAAFNNTHAINYGGTIRRIEKRNKLREGQLARYFGTFCEPSLMGFAKQVESAYNGKKKIPEVPYKFDYKAD
jgi:hypothetical protein